MRLLLVGIGHWQGLGWEFGDFWDIYGGLVGGDGEVRVRY